MCVCVCVCACGGGEADKRVKERRPGDLGGCTNEYNVRVPVVVGQLGPCGDVVLQEVCEDDEGG